jgi:hypothetical protein
MRMARRVRVEFEGATYHVMCRGDRRENIFEDDLDRTRFLQTLGEEQPVPCSFRLGVSANSAEFR